MIRISTIDPRVVTLECDGCLANLRTPIRCEPGQFYDLTMRNQLRRLAQEAGWYHFATDIWGRGIEDLCPACYTLPEEG